MSVVGPRPHMLQHTDYYSSMIDKYMIRQFLKPGITGWAQVNGFRGETKTLEKMQGRVQFDIWYIENWSIWLDIKIIFMTVFNTLKGDKNAF
jgi:putative colanic acid biosynthesis UDP-glucose lipid carrier transferase